MNDVPIRVLTFTTLYPNEAMPNHGVFVENRLRHLVGHAGVVPFVLAPVPWFPSKNARFGSWARHAAAPYVERRNGIEVRHPRFVAIPRIGTNVSPALLWASARRALRRLLDEGHVFDLIDAHYFYPDGVAAVWLGKEFGLPVVITARGSDVTQFPDMPIPRKFITEAAVAADAVITVSAGLKVALERLGVPAERITVLRNGVDLQRFRPPSAEARQRARAALGWTDRPTLLSVGSLIERKGHDLTIAALNHLPKDWRLVIVGEGPEHRSLVDLVNLLGLADRVTLLGPRPHGGLPYLYGAADISVLSSSREGWANVLLESMACGTPVVASPIPGNDEVIQHRDAGIIASARTPDAIASAVLRLSDPLPDRSATAGYAAGFSWDATSIGQMNLFSRVLADFRSR